MDNRNKKRGTQGANRAIVKAVFFAALAALIIAGIVALSSIFTSIFEPKNDKPAAANSEAAALSESPPPSGRISPAPGKTAAPASPAAAPSAKPAQSSTPGAPSALAPSPTAPVGDISGLPLYGAVIGIDAGHQGRANNETEPVSPSSSELKAKVTGGTAGVQTKTPEHEVTLAVALLLKQRLEALGATVVMVREVSNVDISNKERAVLMNENSVALCIRIHCDGSPSAETRGASILIPGGADTISIQDESRTAAAFILDSFLAATSADNRGIVSRSDLTGFNWSSVPVCLIEMGFMSNPEEDALLCDDDYQSRCAEGLANGIEEWWKRKL